MGPQVDKVRTQTLAIQQAGRELLKHSRKREHSDSEDSLKMYMTVMHILNALLSLHMKSDISPSAISSLNCRWCC